MHAHCLCVCSPTLNGREFVCESICGCSIIEIRMQNINVSGISVSSVFTVRALRGRCSVFLTQICYRVRIMRMNALYSLESTNPNILKSEKYV